MSIVAAMLLGKPIRLPVGKLRQVTVAQKADTAPAVPRLNAHGERQRQKVIDYLRLHESADLKTLSSVLCIVKTGAMKHVERLMEDGVLICIEPDGWRGCKRYALAEAYKAAIANAEGGAA